MNFLKAKEIVAKKIKIFLIAIVILFGRYFKILKEIININTHKSKVTSFVDDISSKSSQALTVFEDKTLEREFLPAALEIVETPPAPLGRFVTYTICIFVIFILIWAYYGRVDIVAVAPGKFVTASRTQIIQAPEIGVVKEIYIKRDQLVKKDDALIQLDTTAIISELEKAKTDYQLSILDVKRLDTFILNKDYDISEFKDFDPIYLSNAKSQLLSQKKERDGKVNALEEAKKQKIAELKLAEDTLVKLETLLPIIEQKYEIRRKGAESEYGSKLLSLEALQQLMETKSEIILSRSRIDAAYFAIKSLDQQIEQTQSELIKNAYSDLTRANAQVNAALEIIRKSQKRLDIFTIRSPIDGVIAQLNLNTIGGVVTPAQQLLTIVPDNEDLEIECVLQNKDAGFVVPNQDVEIKVDAYPFTRYGLLKGYVYSISADSDIKPQPSDLNSVGTERKVDLSQGIEGSEQSLYRVKVKLLTKELNVEGKTAKLTSGMSLKAEIKTGNRTILSFLMSPVSEYIHQSLRER